LEDLEAVKQNPRSRRSAEVRAKLMDIFNDSETDFWKAFQDKARLRCHYTGRRMEDALYNAGHLLWNTRQALAYQAEQGPPAEPEPEPEPLPLQARNDNLFTTIISQCLTLTSPGTTKGQAEDEPTISDDISKPISFKKEGKGNLPAKRRSHLSSSDDSTAVMTLDSECHSLRSLKHAAGEEPSRTSLLFKFCQIQLSG
jgi:hypothetical protein